MNSFWGDINSLHILWWDPASIYIITMTLENWEKLLFS